MSKKKGYWKEEFESGWELNVRTPKKMNGQEFLNLNDGETKETEYILMTKKGYDSAIQKAKEEGSKIGYTQALKDEHEEKKMVYSIGYEDGSEDANNKTSVVEKKMGTVKGKEGRKKILTAEQIEKCQEYRLNGRSLRSIAKEMGVSHQTIKNTLEA